MNYELKEAVAVLGMDDGKANAVGHELLDAINDGLDRALSEAGAVLLVGRDGVFSAGFDLKEFQKGAAATAALLDKGARTLLRLFAHPQPVVAACTGHAIAAGGFLLLTADTRVGAAGDFKIGLTETALGMSFPVFGIELARTRLDPRHLTRSFVQSHVYDPDDAIRAGFLDRVLPADQVLEAALAEAARLAELPGDAYGKNKRDIRAAAIAAIEASIAE
jgi:enoyl-CoA hydratase